MIPEILKSKKGQAFLVVAAAIMLRNFLGLSEADITKLVALAGSYVLGQGVADHGKEAARVQASKQAGEAQAEG